MNIFMLIAVVAFFIFVKKTTTGKGENDTGEYWPTIEPLPVEEDSSMQMGEEKERKLQQLRELTGRPSMFPKKSRSPKTTRQPETSAITPSTKSMKATTKTSPNNASKPSVGSNLRSPYEARRAFIYSEIFKKKYE